MLLFLEIYDRNGIKSHTRKKLNKVLEPRDLELGIYPHIVFAKIDIV